MPTLLQMMLRAHPCTRRLGYARLPEGVVRLETEALKKIKL
jgi:hypothetical protein